MRPPTITIDGPSGTGKGTLANRLVYATGWHVLDSGVLYRVLAYVAKSKGLSLDSASGLAQIARTLALDFQATHEILQVWLNGVDVSADIRSEETGSAASRIAAIAGVRSALLDRQREFLRPPGLIADGRDMGTVVFPNAELKIFLTASPSIRAKRRYKQLKQKGIDVSLARLSEDIAARDRRDQEREVSPLQPAGDAKILDTSALDIDAVEKSVIALLKERGLS